MAKRKHTHDTDELDQDHLVPTDPEPLIPHHPTAADAGELPPQPTKRGRRHKGADPDNIHDADVNQDPDATVPGWGDVS